MAKVSIIMPVYNKAEYLVACFEALLSQSFKDWELIVVNDGSKDNSSQIIKRYVEKDNRVIYIEQENGGVSVARNKGIEKASGEWIWFVDADDVPNVNFLSEVFQYEYDEDCHIIVGSYECSRENQVVSYVDIDESGKISSERLPELFMKYQYKTGFWGYLWNKLLRREILKEKYIRFKEGLTLAEDLKFMVKIYRENINVFSVPYRAMTYTVDAINSSKEKKVDYEEQLKIQLEIKEWIIDCKNKKEFADFFKNIISKYVAFIVFYGYENNEEYMRNFKESIGDKKIQTQLCTDGMKGIMFIIVWCIIHERFLCLQYLLLIRKKLRNIYRVLQKKK